MRLPPCHLSILLTPNSSQLFQKNDEQAACLAASYLAVVILLGESGCLEGGARGVFLRGVGVLCVHRDEAQAGWGQGGARGGRVVRREERERERERERRLWGLVVFHSFSELWL